MKCEICKKRVNPFKDNYQASADKMYHQLCIDNFHVEYISKQKVKDALSKFHKKFHRSVVTECKARRFIEKELGME